MTRIITFLLLFLPGLAAAQSYPDYQDTKINDQAGLITHDTESRLREALTVLKVETGIEATVLTLESWQSFAGHQDFKGFATGLFNHWGIGDAATDNGILILVARNEREIRIELGLGYGDGYNWIAGELIESEFLPRFREDDYDTGIDQGTRAVIEQIANPFSQGLAATTDVGNTTDATGDNGGSRFGILAGVIAAIVALLVYLKKKSGVANRSCPTCGRKTLSQSSQVLRQPTEDTDGSREDTTRCSSCGYLDISVVTLARIREGDSHDGSGGGSGGSFGGGSSSGGGASGKW